MKLADALGEQGIEAHKRLSSYVKRLGGAMAVELLEQTLAIEKTGGMLTNDGSRRRTKGGVFFKLAKERLYGQQPVRASEASVSGGEP